MKVAHAVLMSVAALLIGAMAGYVAAPGPGPAVRPVEQLPDPAYSAPTTQPEPARTSEPVSSDPVVAPATNRTEAQSDPLAAWLETFAGDLPKAGDGRIFGRVTLPGEKGLQGVTVTASPQFPGAYPSAFDSTLEEQLEKYARRAHFYRRGTLTAVTDEDGRYELVGVGEYGYDMRATVPSHEVRISSSPGYPIRKDSEVNWIANPVSAVEFDIRLEDGSRPDDVRLIFQYGDRRERRYSWTPDAPLIKAEAGRCTVSATAGEYENYQMEGLKITLRDGATPERHEIILRPVPGIVCIVHMPPELQGRVSPRIHLFGNPPADPPGRALESPGQTSSLGTRGNRHQSTFPSLEPGRYRLVVTCFGMVMEWRDVDLGPGLEVVTLDVPPLNPADFIVARAYSPDGELLPDAQLRAAHSGRDAPHGPNHFTLPRGDGSFWLLRRVRADHESCATGTWAYMVSAQTKEHGLYNVPYPANGTHELELRYPHPASLTVHLPGASNHPLRERLRPSLARASESGGWAVFGARKLQDSLEYGPTLPGSYRFTLTIAEPDADPMRDFMRGTVVAEWKFDLTSGSSTRTFQIPALYTLTLHIPDVQAVGQLHVLPVDGPGSRSIQRSNLTERMEIVGLAPGEWVLQTRRGEMKIRISGDTEATLAVREFDCLRLSGIKPGGRIEALGLREGDLLIGVDGQEYDGLEMLVAQVRGAFGKDETTWEILRQGVPTRVTFNGKALLQIESAEGPDRERIQIRPALRN